jgi:hypothetical protein
MTDETKPGPPAVEPMPPAAEPPPLVSPPPAAPPRQPSRLRTYIVIGVIVAFLGIVLWAVRNNQSASDLAIGTCFDRPAGSSISTVEKHGCTEPHDAEVFHVAAYTPAGAYPGDTEFQSYIDGACAPVFESYVGEPVDSSEDLSYGWYYPSEDGWNGGNHTFTCYAARKDEAKLTESVKSSAGS